MLEARNITLPGRLQDCSVRADAGTITAICGPNGAGKSSLLQVLAGILATETGEVRFDNVPVNGLGRRTRAQRIGYLPQDGQVAWDISIRILAGLGRLPHRSGAERDREATEAALVAMSLQHMADRPVGELSGGERARALLARVLAGEPDCVLADEPLANLDLGYQALLLRYFRSLAESGKAVAIVLHDLAAALNHADRVIVMDRGRVVQDGPPEAALAPHVLQSVWGVKAIWLGEPGQRALSIRG